MAVDGFEQAVVEVPRARLTYPFDRAPEFGEAIDVMPGVKWLRMPLSSGLGFINVWSIAEGDGWAIIDTGIGGADAQATWRTALAGSLGGKPVTRVFVTHMHPDHIGMSGWLTRKYHCRLWSTRLELVTCRSLAADTGREAPEGGVEFYRAPAGVRTPSKVTASASAGSGGACTPATGNDQAQAGCGAGPLPVPSGN